MPETQPDLREALARYIIGPRCPVPPTSKFTLAELQEVTWRRATSQEAGNARWIAERMLSGPLAPILAQVSALQAEVEALKAERTASQALAEMARAERDEKHAELLAFGEMYEREDSRVDAEIRRLEAEVERLQKVEGEREKERVPAALGSQASPEAPSDLCPKGFDPARDALAATLQHLSNRAYPGIWDMNWDQDFESIVSNGDADGLEPPWNGGDIICEKPSEGEDSRRHWGRNARFIVALANAYRCGLLVVAPCDRSGEAGETSGLDPQGESTVTGAARQAHIPHPLHTHPNPKREDR